MKQHKPIVIEAGFKIKNMEVFLPKRPPQLSAYSLYLQHNSLLPEVIDVCAPASAFAVPRCARCPARSGPQPALPASCTCFPPRIEVYFIPVLAQTRLACVKREKHGVQTARAMGASSTLPHWPRGRPLLPIDLYALPTSEYLGYGHDGC